MTKLRGQGIFIDLIFGLIAVIIVIATAPIIQTMIVATIFGNATLFPSNSPAYLVAGLVTFVWILLAIIIILLIVSRRNSEG